MLAQWILAGQTRVCVNEAIILAHGCRDATLPELREQLAQLAGDLAQRTNICTSQRMAEAYADARVPFVSGWELDERSVREGRVKASDLHDLLLLVCFGQIDTARPLLRRYADRRAAESSLAAAAISRWIADDAIDDAHRADILAGNSTALKFVVLLGERDVPRATEVLDDSVPRAKRMQHRRPVKTEDALFTQALAFARGEVREALLRKSFAAYFANCYHEGSSTDLVEKVHAAYLYWRLFAPGPAHAAFEYLASCIAVLKRARAPYYAGDVPAVRDALAKLRALADHGPFRGRDDGRAVSFESDDEPSRRGRVTASLIVQSWIGRGVHGLRCLDLESARGADALIVAQLVGTGGQGSGDRAAEVAYAALMDLLEPAAGAWRISPPLPAEPAKLLPELARRVGRVFDAWNAQGAALLAFGTLIHASGVTLTIERRGGFRVYRARAGAVTALLREHSVAEELRAAGEPVPDGVASAMRSWLGGESPDPPLVVELAPGDVVVVVPWLVYERCDEAMIVDGLRDLEALARALPSRCDDGWGLLTLTAR